MATLQAKKRTSKCRVRMECLLWLVVLLMAVLIAGVNVMLLQTASQAPENIVQKRNKRSKIADAPAKRQALSLKDRVQQSKVLLASGQAGNAVHVHSDRNSSQNMGDSKRRPGKQQQHHMPHHHVQLSPAKDPAVKPEKTLEELGPLLKILKHANVTDTPELREKLPTWQQVTHRYGEQPKVLGLETCQEFNSGVPWNQRTLAPAGPFNSGTNLLFEVLNKNCQMPGRSRQRTGVAWQVNWGKHQPPRFRFLNYVQAMNNSNYMPVVPVRDPYTWMQSMCKNRYAAQWLHSPEHCPNLIPTQIEEFYYGKSREFLRQKFKGNGKYVHNVLEKSTYKLGDKTVPVEIHYKSDTIHHTSLVHMWKDWYQEYYDSTFPRLMIRLEDLVFHPRQVLQQVCECVGGRLRDPIALQGESPKKGAEAVHGKNPTNLADAMQLHVFANRTKGMTVDDIKFAKYVLSDSVMDEFGYHPPF